MVVAGNEGINDRQGISTSSNVSELRYQTTASRSGYEMKIAGRKVAHTKMAGRTRIHLDLSRLSTSDLSLDSRHHLSTLYLSETHRNTEHFIIILI